MNQLVYVIVAQAAIALMLTAILFLCWLRVDRRPHALTWSLAFAVVTVSYALNVARGLMPHALYWALVNGLSLAAMGLAFAGFWQRAGRPPRPRRLLAVLLGAELLVVWFRVGTPHVGLTMAIVPLCSMAAMVGISVVLLRQERRLGVAERGMIFAAVFFGISQGVAGFVALQQGPDGDASVREVYNQVSFLTMPAAFAGIGMFALFIIASDLADGLRSLALTDQLTGVTNRRGFWEAAERARAEAARTGEPLSIALADIDHFKTVNDTHGHPVGDRVLQATAVRLGQELRAGDLMARVGGEEFAFLFPRTDEAAAHGICERLRNGMAMSPVVVDQIELEITCSFGLSSVDVHDTSIQSAIAAVDRSLYQSKIGGRNQVSSTGAAD